MRSIKRLQSWAEKASRLVYYKGHDVGGHIRPPKKPKSFR